MNATALDQIRQCAASGRPLTLVQAVHLFDHLADLENIAHNMPQDACYARSHLMCREMQKLGLDAQKAWAFEEGDMISVHMADGKTLRWWYHTAPALDVELTDGSFEKMIFDPALFDGPVTKEEWCKLMGTSIEDAKILKFDEYPKGEPGNYTPNDDRVGLKGKGITDTQTDIAAQVLMDRHLQMQQDLGNPRRVVFSSESRQMVSLMSAEPLPRERKSWMSFDVYKKLKASTSEPWEALGGLVKPVSPARQP